MQLAKYYFYNHPAMPRIVKKLLVLLPVVVLGFFFIKAQYRGHYSHASFRRTALLFIPIVLFYGPVFFMCIQRKQESLWKMIVQSSFFVYLFMVLTLTGYFILFRELSIHGWWDNMMSRIDRRDHVNFRLFEMFRIYQLSDKQIVGNFVMLLPMGIYLPLLFKKLSGFFAVLLAGFLIATTIETLQLVTNFRSVDVDDIFLNTTGVAVGYCLYKIAQLLTGPGRRSQQIKPTT